MAKPPTQIWHKEWPQPAVDSFQLEGTGRLQLPQIWTFWDGFWSTFFYTWTGESTSKGFWENWGIGRTRCSPSLSHLPSSSWLSLVPTWKKISPDLCDLFSNLQVHHHYQTLLRSLESGSHGWLLWYVSMTPVLRTLPLMRPRRFKCLPNTQIKQILRGVALQHGVPSMSPCPMIQNKKQEGHSMESCKLCKLQLNFCWNISGTNSQNPKMQSCSVEMPIAVLVSSAPPLLLPQRHAKSRLCLSIRDGGCWRFWVRDAKNPGIGTKTQLARATFTPSPGGNWEI